MKSGNDYEYVIERGRDTTILEGEVHHGIIFSYCFLSERRITRNGARLVRNKMISY
jgi:hypothetical protein